MAKSTVSQEESLGSLSRLFRVLSDKTRLQIVLILAEGERNVGSLSEELKLGQPIVSHHLGLLRMNRVVINKRAGGTGLISDLDGNFPYTWYLEQIQSRITGNWNRLSSAQGRVQIYFRIKRDGTIDGARVERADYDGTPIPDGSVVQVIHLISGG